MLRSVVLVLAAAVALAGSPARAAPRKVAVLLVPYDREAHAAAARLTQYLEEAVGANSSYRLVESQKLLGDPTPADAVAARKRVQDAVREGKKLLSASQAEEAESQLRRGLSEVDAAAAALDKCGEYCDALAYLSAAQLMRGDEQGARDTLKQLLAVDRGYRFDGPGFGKNFQVLIKEVQRSANRELMLTNLQINAQPPGGNVYLDGQLKGVSPLTLERIPAGRHLLRIERAGAVTFGQLLEVAATEESTVRPRLTLTNEYSEIQQQLEQVVDSFEKFDNGEAIKKLGSKVKLDRALVGSVRSGDQRLTLDVALVDFAARSKVLRRTRSFDGDEYGELEKETRRFANLMLSEADAKPDPKAKQSKDPLESRSGTEDWDEE